MSRSSLSYGSEGNSEQRQTCRTVLLSGRGAAGGCTGQALNARLSLRAFTSFEQSKVISFHRTQFSLRQEPPVPASMEPCTLVTQSAPEFVPKTGQGTEAWRSPVTKRGCGPLEPLNC